MAQIVPNFGLKTSQKKDQTMWSWRRNIHHADFYGFRDEIKIIFYNGYQVVVLFYGSMVCGQWFLYR